MNRLVRADSLPVWRNTPALLAALVGIDMRRPASWITLAMGLSLGWWCASGDAAGGGIAILSAAVVTVAAIGDVPTPICVPAGRGMALLWAGERAAWPLVGAMLGMLVAGGGAVAHFVTNAAVDVLAGGLLATLTTVAGARCGAKAADAASLTLLLAAASAAAGGGIAPWLGGGSAGAVTAWLLLGGLGWGWSRSQRSVFDAVLPEPQRPDRVTMVDMLHVDAVPSNGPMRQTLTRLAMVAALVAMVVWLMLDPAVAPGDEAGPHRAAEVGVTQSHGAALAWGLFTAVWFIGLSVPQATLQDGLAGAGGWDRLVRTAAGPDRGGAGFPRSFGYLRPGPVRCAGGVALSLAAILGWPVLVCAVLAAPTPSAAWPPLAIVLGLAAAAAAVTAMVALGTAAHVSRETTFAVVLAVTVGLLAVVAADMRSSRRAISPASPISPRSRGSASPASSRRFAARADVAGNGLSGRNFAVRVEKSHPEAR